MSFSAAKYCFAVYHHCLHLKDVKLKLEGTAKRFALMLNDQNIEKPVVTSAQFKILGILN